jgi:hypothetical protein
MMTLRWNGGRRRPRDRSFPLRKTTAAALALLAATALTATGAGTAGAAPTRPAYNPVYTAVNADGGIYWRSTTNWNSPIQRPGWGFYNGDQISLSCYKFGDPYPSPQNHLWYSAVNLSRWDDPSGNFQSGWINDHFLNTPGTATSPQPIGLPCG